MLVTSSIHFFLPLCLFSSLFDKFAPASITQREIKKIREGGREGEAQMLYVLSLSVLWSDADVNEPLS